MPKPVRCSECAFCGEHRSGKWRELPRHIRESRNVGGAFHCRRHVLPHIRSEQFHAERICLQFSEYIAGLGPEESLHRMLQMEQEKKVIRAAQAEAGKARAEDKKERKRDRKIDWILMGVIAAASIGGLILSLANHFGW